MPLKFCSRTQKQASGGVFWPDLPDFLPSVLSGTSASFTSFCTAYPYWSSTNAVTTTGIGFGAGFGDGGRRIVGGCCSWNCGGSVGVGRSMSWNRTVSVLAVRLFSKLRLRRIWKKLRVRIPAALIVVAQFLARHQNASLMA